jgi:hypothetical protein
MNQQKGNRFWLYAALICCSAPLWAQSKAPCADAASFKCATAEALDALDSASEEEISSDVVFKLEYAKARDAVNKLRRLAGSDDEKRGATLALTYLMNIKLCQFVHAHSQPIEECSAREKNTRDQFIKQQQLRTWLDVTKADALAQDRESSALPKAKGRPQLTPAPQ